MCTPVGQYEQIVWGNGSTFGNAFGVDWRCVGWVGLPAFHVSDL